LVIAAFEKIADAVLQSEETNRAVGIATWSFVSFFFLVE
jgi:hypothetical protein